MSKSHKSHPFSPKFLDHVAIRVKDVEKSVSWYYETIGLQAKRHKEWGPYPVMLLAGDSGIAVFPEKDENEDLYRNIKVRKPEISHFAFRISREEFEAATSYFREKDIPFTFQDHDIFQSLYLKDPDGFTVELTAEIFKT